MGKKKSKGQLKSVCCNANVQVYHVDTSLWYTCKKCKEACKVYLKERKIWTINPTTKIKKDERKKFKDKLTKKDIENYRKNEDF
jgi:ABC-type proline/glycine betaine transport system substrate-binding protein